jgi:hypothetical protein
VPKSKKRSGTKPSPPDRLVYFVDQDLGTKIVPGALRVQGARVEVLTRHFKPATPDVDWIPRVAAKGWVIVTKDRNIMRNRLEREAVLRARAAYVCVAAKGLRGEEIAQLVSKHFGMLDGLLRAAPRPIIVRLRHSSVCFFQDGDWITARKRHHNPAWWRRKGSLT